jgi:3-hydroxyisobutyrate dehydrogenase-like beta-hydroxyacid dehydrogenase
MLKDMNLASGMKVGAGLPALELVRARLAAAAKAGHADEDFSVLIKLFEKPE